MKLLIQHNFKTGLGDMYNDMVEYMTTVKKYKDMGWEVHLIFCLYDNKYIREKVFNKIFDDETINYFDSVEETFQPIRDKKYKEFYYNSSAHEPQNPGTHRWDIFTDTNIEKIELLRLPTHVFRIKVENVIKPQFRKYLIDGANDFVKSIGRRYNLLHIRNMDSEKNETKYLDLKNKFLNFLEHNKEFFHLGTNNRFLDDNLKNLDNVITYKFTTFDSIDNELNATFNSKLNNEQLFLRLCETIQEMISIRSAKKIYSYTDYGWISLFLLYGILEGNKKEKDFIKINF